jgi:DNA-binding transcriptional LysR family regulator
MELRHLRYFAAVAETGNLSRAAEKLFIAQPPLSVQIRQLEEELGQALFTRHPKGVRLTAAGQALLPEARYLVDRAARVVEVVRQAGKGPSGNLSVGFVPSASSTVLPVLVRQLRRLHAGVNLELREMISSEQIDALVAGHIDAGIARTPTRHPRLAVASRMPDAFCLAVPRRKHAHCRRCWICGISPMPTSSLSLATAGRRTSTSRSICAARPASVRVCDTKQPPCTVCWTSSVQNSLLRSSPHRRRCSASRE